MDEFLTMIYRTYTESTGGGKSYCGEDTEKFMNELDAILSKDLVMKIDELFIDSAAEIEKNAFMDGFAYACKCLSNGKIEFSK